MSNSCAKETDRPMVLCNNCRAWVVLTKLKERPTPRQSSKFTATPSNELGGGQRQKVFHRLGPQEWTDGPTSARRRLDFNVPFYNEDYYLRNSSSSSSSVNQKTFKPPKPQINVGTVTTLPLACILHYPNIKNVEVSR
ncbi:hypothetical protein PS2_027474 [Malus domestica]